MQVIEVRVFFCTSRHLLHEDLDEAILTDGAQVLHNVPVLQPLVQSDFLMEGLRVPGVGKQLQRRNSTGQNLHSGGTSGLDMDMDMDTAAVTETNESN